MRYSYNYKVSPSDHILINLYHHHSVFSAISVLLKPSLGVIVSWKKLRVSSRDLIFSSGEVGGHLTGSGRKPTAHFFPILINKGMTH